MNSWRWSREWKIALIAAGLFALNAIVCARLFHIEYLDDLQSNEASYITFGHFLARYWPHVAWFPWYNAGMPFEDTYLPLVGILVATVSRAAHCSPAHAFHFISALTYALAPVFLFLFARALSGRLGASAWAALLWSVFSPAMLFPKLWTDMGGAWGIRRLENMVYYGETPHNVALCLLPLVLWQANRFLDAPGLRRFALASLATAAVMLSNAFGIVVVSACFLMLLAARREYSVRSLLYICGILVAAYLAICRFLPPKLIRLIEINSQLVGGDYRFTLRTPLIMGTFLAVLIAVWALTRRYCGPMVQFAVMFTASFGGITWLSFYGINLLPQPQRYDLEMEVGLCLLAAFVVDGFAGSIPRRIRLAARVVALAAVGIAAVKDQRFAHRLIHRADPHAPAFAEARWIAANLPGQRILDATEGQWLFNLFADNPQMGAGHEPSAPNYIQRIAVYTIYTATNAGAQDEPISLLWLKVFGCAAIIVPGAASNDHYHAIANPGKFARDLPVVWSEGGDSIYRVPLRSTSLAHVIPRSAVVTRRPLHGLDVEPVQPYAAALEDPAIEAASLSWKNPDEGVIRAKMAPGQVISVQETFDSGWRARVGGKAVDVEADQLGFMVIDPQCSGECTIELDFDGGAERAVMLAISLAMTAALLAMIVWRRLEPTRKLR